MRGLQAPGQDQASRRLLSVLPGHPPRFQPPEILQNLGLMDFSSRLDEN